MHVKTSNQMPGLRDELLSEYHSPLGRRLARTSRRYHGVIAGEPIRIVVLVGPVDRLDSEHSDIRSGHKRNSHAIPRLANLPRTVGVIPFGECEVEAGGSDVCPIRIGLGVYEAARGFHERLTLGVRIVCVPNASCVCVHAVCLAMWRYCSHARTCDQLFVPMSRTMTKHDTDRAPASS